MNAEHRAVKADEWPERRLLRAEAIARARETTDEWRRLRNLAAAYGRLDVARMAQERLVGLAGPVEERRASERNPLRSERPAGAGGGGIRIRIRSAMPLARAAWLARWAAARGGTACQEVEPDCVTITLPGGRPDLDRLLDSHPELTVIGDAP